MYCADYVLNDVDFCLVDCHAAEFKKPAGFFDFIVGHNAGSPLAAGYFNNGWHYQDTFVERWGNTASTPSAWILPWRPSAGTTAKRLMLSELVEAKAEGAFLDLQHDRSITGDTLKSGWKHYGSGLSIAPYYWLPKQSCAVEYDLSGGAWKHLRATIALELPNAQLVSEDAKVQTQYEFVVKGDGLELYHSDPLSFACSSRQINVDITGVTTLRLEVINKSTGANPVKSVDWEDLRVEK